MKRIEIDQILKEKKVGESVHVKGWVRSVRKSKAFAFLVLNDGSSFNNLQVVLDEGIDGYEEGASLLTGSSVSIDGEIVESGGKGQAVELKATKVQVITKTDNSYPLQKKGTSFEFLRDNAHIRMRTNAFSAVFRVRHALAQATHKFFSDRGFFYLNSPIITGIDAEGAGEQFRVSTIEPGKYKFDKEGQVDYSKDYFGKESTLCVTGQLEAECFAQGMGKVYTFGPTFRSENSNTTRHLAEFWMVEPEVAFNDLEDNIELAADYVKYMIQYALDNCEDELNFLLNNKFLHKDNPEMLKHMETLRSVAKSKIQSVTYTEAIDILNKSGKKFEYPTNWGDELQTEHERFLAEEYFQGPVAVTDYPKDFKAFYMKQNEDGKTVRAMDLLVPGIGELIGGSQREENVDRLIERMKADGMELEPLWWYLDIRRHGGVPSSGFGLGFERMVMYVTGMKNIRDVIAFPRAPKTLEF